jgi:two-component system response regulator DegU
LLTKVEGRGAARPPGLTRQPCLLVSDDNDDIRGMIRLTLTAVLDHLDLQVCEARTGQQAISICHEQQVDVLLLDLHLPDMSGLDVLRRLSSTAGRVPCVLVWSADTGGALKQAVELGAHAALDKLADIDAMADAVIGCLRGCSQFAL